MNSWYNLRIISKRPGKSLDFFLSKQTRVENDLSSENRLDRSLIITKNNSLDHLNEDLSITAHPNHMDIGLFVTDNQSVDEDPFNRNDYFSLSTAITHRSESSELNIEELK